MKTNFKKSPSAHECHFYGKKQSQNQNLEKKNLPWPMSAKSDTLLPDFINVKKNDIFCKSTITLTYSSFLKSINLQAAGLLHNRQFPNLPKAGLHHRQFSNLANSTSCLNWTTAIIIFAVQYQKGNVFYGRGR